MEIEKNPRNFKNPLWENRKKELKLNKSRKQQKNWKQILINESLIQNSYNCFLYFLLFFTFFLINGN